MHFQEKVVKVWLVAGGLALSFRQTVTVRSQPATSYMRQTIFVHNLSARSSGVGKKISPPKIVFCCTQRGTSSDFNNHANHDNYDDHNNHDNQDNQARLAHLGVDFRVILI